MKIKTKYWYWIWKTFLGPSRLRKKFVRTFLLAGFIPLILMGAISIYLVNLTHRIDVEALEKNVAIQISSEVKKILDDAISATELTVAFPDFAPISFVQQDFILESILKENSSLSEISFVCATPNHCELGRETKRWIKSNGNPIASETLRQLDSSPGFKDAMSRKSYLGDVIFENRSPYIRISSPIFNKNSDVIAVLNAEMNLDNITETIKTARLGKTGYVYIADEDGKIISHRNTDFIGRDVKKLPPLEDSKKDNSYKTYSNLEGKSVSGSANRIPDINWIVISEWPIAETQSLIVTIFWQIGIFSILTFILIRIIASWVAFKLIKPISELKQGTSVIGDGNFDYRVNIKTGDEIEDLGKNLNKMAGNLQELRELETIKIKAESLRESLKKEQELSKVKDQFITTISHQLNTPLSVIKWALTELTDPEIKPNRAKESVKIISKSQQDIASIVNDLVTLSEVGLSYERTKTKLVDFGKLVERAIETFRDSLKLKKISVNYKKIIEDAAININEFTIKKTIENLIDNAISYSHEGGQIYIEISGDDKAILFKIADQGIGIPKEDQPSIFEQFFRARNAIKQKNVGTGLGLFISKNIVEGHKGKISFKSEENRGSTFYITIPR